jgi:hypothetical protein
MLVRKKRRLRLKTAEESGGRRENIIRGQHRPFYITYFIRGNGRPKRVVHCGQTQQTLFKAPCARDDADQFECEKVISGRHEVGGLDMPMPEPDEPFSEGSVPCGVLRKKASLSSAFPAIHSAF